MPYEESPAEIALRQRTAAAAAEIAAHDGVKPPTNNCCGLPAIGTPEWHARNAAELAARNAAGNPTIDRNQPYIPPDAEAIKRLRKSMGLPV